MKRKEIIEVAKRMKNFEKEIVYVTKDVTIKAFWEPCDDGSGVYVVDYCKGKTVREANISYGGEDLVKWGYDDTHKDEHPKTFQNILYELEKRLNELEVLSKTNDIRELIVDAEYEFERFLNDFMIKVREADYPADDDEPFIYWREIQCFKDLCNELEIEIPVTPDVYLCDDGNYRIETVGGAELRECTDIEAVTNFLSGWVLCCASSIFQQAEECIKVLYGRIDNLAELVF